METISVQFLTNEIAATEANIIDCKEQLLYAQQKANGVQAELMNSANKQYLQAAMAAWQASIQAYSASIAAYQADLDSYNSQLNSILSQPCKGGANE
jgi:chromosome segregation ATPase